MKLKKIVGFTLAVLTLISAAGCGKSAAPADGGTAPQNLSKLEAIKAAGKITMATSPGFAPYEFEDLTKSGQDAIVGSDIELGKAIAEELGVKLVIEKMDFASIIGAVQAGKVDFAISGFAHKPERAEQVGMAGPYMSEGGQGLLVSKDTKDSYKSFEDFSGKKIAAQNGSIQADLVQKYIPGAELMLCQNVGDGIMQMTSGKVDAVAIATTVAEEFMKGYETLALSDVMFTDYKSGMYAICNKNETELLEFMQKVVTEKDSDGSYKKWVDEAKALAETLQK